MENPFNKSNIFTNTQPPFYLAYSNAPNPKYTTKRYTISDELRYKELVLGRLLKTLTSNVDYCFIDPINITTSLISKSSLQSPSDLQILKYPKIKNMIQHSKSRGLEERENLEFQQAVNIGSQRYGIEIQNQYFLARRKEIFHKHPDLIDSQSPKFFKWGDYPLPSPLNTYLEPIRVSETPIISQVVSRHTEKSTKQLNEQKYSNNLIYQQTFGKEFFPKTKLRKKSTISDVNVKSMSLMIQLQYSPSQSTQNIEFDMKNTKPKLKDNQYKQLMIKKIQSEQQIKIPINTIIKHQHSKQVKSPRKKSINNIQQEGFFKINKLNASPLTINWDQKIYHYVDI